MLPTLVAQTAVGDAVGGERRRGVTRTTSPRSIARANARLDAAIDAGAHRHGDVRPTSSGLAWQLLADDPERVVDALLDALDAPVPTAEQLGRALAYAAALRITRFHTQNDLGDWDTVHHAFTAANALHQALQRIADARAAARPRARRAARLPRPLPQRARGAPARRASHGDLADLDAVLGDPGRASTAPATSPYGYLAAAATRRCSSPTLGHALLREDAEFHWYQVFEAAVRQYHAWPAGSEEGVLHPRRPRPLPGRATRPTRRELSPRRRHRHPPPPRRGPLRGAA